jgi:hypothetical protein
MLEKIIGGIVFVFAALALGWMMAEAISQPDPFYEPAAYRAYKAGNR